MEPVRGTNLVVFSFASSLAILKTSRSSSAFQLFASHPHKMAHSDVCEYEVLDEGHHYEQAPARAGTCSFMLLLLLGRGTNIGDGCRDTDTSLRFSSLRAPLEQGSAAPASSARAPASGGYLVQLQSFRMVGCRAANMAEQRGEPFMGLCLAKEWGGGKGAGDMGRRFLA